MPAGLPLISCSALELLQDAGDLLRTSVVDAELGVDPDRLPGALDRPRTVTRPLLRNGNIAVDYGALPGVDAEGAVVGREGLVVHLKGLDVLALSAIDTAYVHQTVCHT